jgi:chromosome condensin MukBEF complex kleisin-like MukF subunit
MGGANSTSSTEVAMTDEEVAVAIAELESLLDKEMRWPHIDCEKGWHRLVLDCHRELIALDPDYVPAQIKQKFGGLRFYYDTNSDDATAQKMRETVKRYEELSLTTCEVTGGEGVLMNCNGFYQTINPALAPEGSEKVEFYGI